MKAINGKIVSRISILLLFVLFFIFLCFFFFEGNNADDDGYSPPFFFRLFSYGTYIPSSTCEEITVDEKKSKIAWVIGAFSLDYLENLYVLLHGIQEYSNIRNVVIQSHHCVSSKEQVDDYVSLFDDLNIECIQEETLCNMNTRCFGADSKIHLWDESKFAYDKIIYIDADVMFLSSMDELFCLPTEPQVVYGISIGRHGINSGVMVMEPNQEFYDDQIFKEFQNVESDEGLLRNCEHQYFLKKLVKNKIVEKRVFGYEYNVRMSPFGKKHLPNAKMFHFNHPHGKPWKWNATQDHGQYNFGIIQESLILEWKFLDQKIKEQQRTTTPTKV